MNFHRKNRSTANLFERRNCKNGQINHMNLWLWSAKNAPSEGHQELRRFKIIWTERNSPNGKALLIVLCVSFPKTFSLGMLVGSYFWGCLADTKGRKVVLIATLLLDGFCGLLSSVSQYYSLFMLFRFFNGFG